MKPPDGSRVGIGRVSPPQIPKNDATTNILMRNHVKPVMRCLFMSMPYNESVAIAARIAIVKLTCVAHELVGSNV